MGVLGLPAENRPLEPDTCNQVVGKVMVSETQSPCAESGTLSPFCTPCKLEYTHLLCDRHGHELAGESPVIIPKGGNM